MSISPKEIGGSPLRSAAPVGIARRGDRVRAVEEGLSLFHEVQDERDELKRKLEEANLHIKELNLQVDSLNDRAANLESERTIANAERDKAIAEAAAYSTLLASIMAMCRAFKLPAIPKIKDALTLPDPESPPTP